MTTPNTNSAAVMNNGFNKDFKNKILSQLEVSLLSLRNNPLPINPAPPSPEVRSQQAPKKCLLHRASSFKGTEPCSKDNKDKKPGHQRLLDVESITKIDDVTEMSNPAPPSPEVRSRQAPKKCLLHRASSFTGTEPCSKDDKDKRPGHQRLLDVESVTKIDDVTEMSIPSESLSPRESCTRVNRGTKKKKFSEKLIDALSQEDTSQGMKWLPDGKSFVIVSRKYCVENVLPKYFKEAKFESFLRKLKRWGFKRLPRSVGVDAFYNENFVRGNRDLCRRMRSNSTAMAPRAGKIEADETAGDDCGDEGMDEKCGDETEECFESRLREFTKMSEGCDVGVDKCESPVTMGEAVHSTSDMSWTPKSSSEDQMILPPLLSSRASDISRSLLRQGILERQQQHPNSMSSMFLSSHQKSLASSYLLGKRSSTNMYLGSSGVLFPQGCPGTGKLLPSPNATNLMLLSKLKGINPPMMTPAQAAIGLYSKSQVAPPLSLQSESFSS